jgi:regulator of protease activity HflC (stomatin/prohibitin superfamily)
MREDHKPIAVVRELLASFLSVLPFRSPHRRFRRAACRVAQASRRIPVNPPAETPNPLRLLELSMTSFFAIAVFVLIALVAVAVAIVLGQSRPELGAGVGVLGVLLAAFVASAIKVANQWERAIVLRLGKYQGTRGPGLFLVIPILDRVRLVDTRVLTEGIRRQEVITRDNVPVMIDGVLFFKVVNVESAVMQIQDYAWGVIRLAQTALRDVVGGVTLDELLAEREHIGKLVQAVVEQQAQEWGLEVTGIRLQDIGMPEELKKIMSRQAAAEREKRATITKAEGDRLAADNLAAAAATMTASPGAMQLRTLQTIDGLGPQASNTVVLAVPIEVMELAHRLSESVSGTGRGAFLGRG